MQRLQEIQWKVSIKNWVWNLQINVRIIIRLLKTFFEYFKSPCTSEEKIVNS